MEEDGLRVPVVQRSLLDAVAVAYAEGERLDVCRSIFARHGEYRYVGDVVLDEYGIGLHAGRKNLGCLAGLP